MSFSNALYQQWIYISMFHMKHFLIYYVFVSRETTAKVYLLGSDSAKEIRRVLERTNKLLPFQHKRQAFVLV